MKIFRTLPAAALAMAAALSLTATPAFARGWGHRHYDRDGIDAGDIFAGLLVIGGIAAIAGAASKKSNEPRRDDYRYPDDGGHAEDDYRAPPGDYGVEREDRPVAPYGARSGNLNGAVDSCVNEVERDNRQVDSVDAVNRDGDGWRVEGRTGDGRGFSCSVDGDGRVRVVSDGV